MSAKLANERNVICRFSRLQCSRRRLFLDRGHRRRNSWQRGCLRARPALQCPCPRDSLCSTSARTRERRSHVPLARDVGTNSARIHIPRAHILHDVPSSFPSYAKQNARNSADAKKRPATPAPESDLLSFLLLYCNFFRTVWSSPLPPFSLLYPLHHTHTLFLPPSFSSFLLHFYCLYGSHGRATTQRERRESYARSAVYEGTAVSFRNSGDRGVSLCKRCTRGELLDGFLQRGVQSAL